MPFQKSESNSEVHPMRRTILPYNPHLKTRARQLRQQMTRTEIILWKHLQRKQLYGYDFDRQRPIDAYIVDFFCKELMLAIEIDGVTHDNAPAQERDRSRQQRLATLGVRVLRFRDEEVLQNLEGVLEAIRQWVEEETHPGLRPPLRGGESAPTMKVR
jgi:very-short-patch-repair endonuclease